MGGCLGLLLAVVVTSANVQDRDGARALLKVVHHRFIRLRLICADSAYAGYLATWLFRLRACCRIRLELIKRSSTSFSMHSTACWYFAVYI